jgi:NAD(P)H-hydrate epimerase
MKKEEVIKTSDINSIEPFIKQLHIPKPNSHKGQNGKLLIIGGSSLFHAASLWSTAIASRIVDIVHYCSAKENEQVFINLKSKFVDGIVVKQKDLKHYLEEDDCILVGPGMIRGEVSSKFKVQSFDKLRIDPEQSRTGQSSKLYEFERRIITKQ